jgi:hypothetical protein
VEWDAFAAFCERLEEKLRGGHDVAGIARWETSFARSSDPSGERRSEDLERFAAGIDAAVVGIAA